MFSDYPDVVTINEIQKMLGVGKNTAYRLIHTKAIKSVQVGRKYLIPKKSVIEYLNGVAPY